MYINESVSVETLSSGAPIRFHWRGVTYGVVSSPEPWISRRSWWTEGVRVARGSAATLLEIPMWRVDALPLTDGANRLDGTFDLAQPHPTSSPVDGSGSGSGSGSGWILVTAVSEELDERLFA
jgi:hypothetical protein